MLPPALQKIDTDHRVIGYYSDNDVAIGCAPTHPDVEIVIMKEESKKSRTYVNLSA